MDAELVCRFQPEEYCRRFLDGGVRPDGRSLETRREARVERPAVESANGSASVRLGHSAAVAAVRVEVVELQTGVHEQPNVTCTVDMPPLCGAAFRERHGEGQAAASYVANALTQILNNVAVLNPAQLLIEKDRFHWSLFVDVVCLNYDGNAFDLCVLAALAAVEDTVLPAVALYEAPDESTRLVTVPAGEAALSPERALQLTVRPLPVTFAQLPGQQWAVDPTATEEELGALVSLCLVGEKWMVFHRGGGAGADCFLQTLMPAARAHVAALREVLAAPSKRQRNSGGA